MRMSRQEFLKLGILGAAGLLLPAGTFGIAYARAHAAANLKSPPVDPFAVPLPVPPVLKPARKDATTDYYEVTQRADKAEILPGLETPVWGYEGVFPGPTIEARSGRTIVIRQKNGLPVPVSTHLHGGVTPPESDGYPTDLVEPEGYKDYVYPNEQRASTHWYHDHRMDFTGPQVWRGLAGFYLIRDDEEDALPLPKGEKDVPVMIADRLFAEDGSFYYPSLDPSLAGEPGVLGAYSDGVLGDTVLVNGAVQPFFEVSNTRYRFRFLNASNARRYRLALDSGRPLVQVGSDGGLLSAPQTLRSMRISPAERFDVVVDFSEYPVGSKVVLKNLRGKGSTADVMRFDVVRNEKDESEVPAELAPLEELDPFEAAATRSFQFERNMPGAPWVINGKRFDPGRMDARPRLGSTEVWTLDMGFGGLRHPDGVAHPVHPHLIRFRVLDRNGEKPFPEDAGWKDTVDLLLPHEKVRVAARFSGYRGRYAFHCHNLEHEDMRMMGNFEVV
jgi:spore coat protein A, manganese oxidase